jgi:fucose 4-O-acetylase-like acetyltransferase
MTTPRLVWIDIAKGIGLLLVVVAHVLLHSPATWTAPVTRSIYLFHMPLFFLLAGLTLRPEPLQSFARRRTLTLLLPYLLFLTVLGIPALAATCTLGTPFPDLGIDRCTILPPKLPLGGSTLGGIFGAFWFIPCLLWALILAQAILQLSGATRLRAIALLALTAFTLPSLLPWSTALLALGVAPMAALLVLVGHQLSQTRYWLGFPALLPMLVFAALTIFAQAPIDMKFGHNGFPILSMIGAIALSCLLIRLSQRLANWLPVGALLSALGERSLTILFLHQAIHLSLRQLGIHNDALIITLSLAIPLLLHEPLRQLLKRTETRLFQHLFRKSPQL